MQTKNILVLIVVLAITITGWWVYKNEKTVLITSFDECVAAGNPILESYPEQCRTADGQTFTRPVEDTPDISNFIRVSNPQPMSAVKSPLKITGEARGTWFFEASFPVVLQDDNGKILAQGIATAQTDWMTEDFVPFEAELTFEQPDTGSGKLILKKDNPSGLPENDNELAIPVQFTI